MPFAAGAALQVEELAVAERHGAKVQEIHMSEHDLELLITLDNPGDAREEDTFAHLQVNNIEYWLGRRFPASYRIYQRAEAVGDDAYKVTFGQGDWTCTLARFPGTPPNKPFDIEVCTITNSKNGEIVEQKVFYDLVETQKQIGLM